MRSPLNRRPNRGDHGASRFDLTNPHCRAGRAIDYALSRDVDRHRRGGVRCSPVPKMRHGVHVGNDSQVTVGFLSSVLGAVVRSADRATDEGLSDAVAATVGNGVWIDADLDARDHHGRRALRRGFIPEASPKPEGVNRPLKRVDDLYTASRVVADERPVRRIIAALFKRGDGLRNRAVHRFRFDEAGGNALPRELVLDDQGPSFSRVFRLPQDRHLRDGRCGGEVVGELRGRKPRQFANGRTRHG
ncbi:hypothetical protein E1H18_2644 [Caulobacter sp. RHG1]|nr:hypothetical protein [Caulobacter sp. RHG1]